MSDIPSVISIKYGFIYSIKMIEKNILSIGTKKLNLKPILSGEKQELQMLRLEIEGLLTLFPPGCLACLL